MCRLAPEVVAARQAILDRCLVCIVQAPAPFHQAAPLLAFLVSPNSHWPVSGQASCRMSRQARDQAGKDGKPP